MSARSSADAAGKRFRFADLFAGIWGFRLGFEAAGWECVFSSEWDPDAQWTYRANFGETPAWDVTKIPASDVPDIDVLCWGFPCQAFSVSGKRMGFDDARGTLFFDVARIAKEKLPKAIVLENVKNFAGHDGGRTLATVKSVLDSIGYPYGNQFHAVLKSSDYGVPQKRERIYLVAFRDGIDALEFSFPKPFPETVVVSDVLEELDEDGFAKFEIRRKDVLFDRPASIPEWKDRRSPYRVGKIGKGGQWERVYSAEAAGITLSAYGWWAASKTGAYLVGGRVRKLTPRECARMQWFPETFVLHPRRNACYRQFGNSVSVPVVWAIAKAVSGFLA